MPKAVGWLVACGAAALLAVTGCTSSSPSAPTSSASVSSAAPVYLDGDVTRIGLTGSSSSPLRWEQPSGLTASQAAIALTLQRQTSLFLILTSAQRPTGVRFDPLLAGLATGPTLASEQSDYGDGNRNGYPGTLGGDNHYAVHIVAITTPAAAGGVQNALVQFCSRSSGAPEASSGPFVDGLTKAADGSPDQWLYTGSSTTKPTVQFDCAAWAKSLPS